MVSVLVCFSMALLLYFSSADGNPTDMYEMEAFYPEEKPILRQLPQNYWYRPRLGKRDWSAWQKRLGFNYDSEDPAGYDIEKRAHNERKFNSIFTPRTGKRSDALIGTLSYLTPHLEHFGEKKPEQLEAISGKSY